MKILLVMPRFRPFGQNYDFPMGVCYISAALKKAGHEVVCLNLNNDSRPVADMVGEAVRAHDPQVCGCGGLTPHYEAIQAVFDAARFAKPSITNLIGGGVFSSAPETIAQLLDIDVGVIGEGENSVVEMAAALDAGEALDTVQGLLINRGDGTSFRTPTRPSFKTLDDLAWPDLDGFGIDQLFETQFQVDNFSFNVDDEPRCLPMISSRSCPFSCTFCFHPNGRVYRERSLEDFFAELDDRIERYGVKLVTILDELFATKRARLIEFCEIMKTKPVQWMAQLHVSVVSEETIKLMKESGCVAIGYGLESMSLPVLKSMQKKTTPEQVDKALALTRKYKIGVIGTFIFGDPADTQDTTNETLDWWARNRELIVSLMDLKVLPGSPVWHRALAENKFKDGADSILNPYINLTNFDDGERADFQWRLNVFRETVLVPAHLRTVVEEGEHPRRGPLARFDWDCPSCGNHNSHGRIPLYDGATFAKVRLACRNCLGLFHLPNTARQDVASPEYSQRRNEALAFAQKGVSEGDVDALGNALSLYRDILREVSPAEIESSQALRQACTEFADLAEGYAADRKTIARAVGNALRFDPWNAKLHIRWAKILMSEGNTSAATLYLRTAQRLISGDFSVPDQELHKMLDACAADAGPVYVQIKTKTAEAKAAE